MGVITLLLGTASTESGCTAFAWSTWPPSAWSSSCSAPSPTCSAGSRC